MSFKISLVFLIGCLAIAAGSQTPFGANHSSSDNTCAEFFKNRNVQTVVINNLNTIGAFEIENTGDDIELDGRVRIERKEGDEWRPLPNYIELSLIEKCEEQKTSSCMTLSKGGKMSPVPWTGFSCKIQCFKACRKDAYLGPGTFRFVVSSCDQKQKFYGSEFELPTLKQYYKLKGKKN